MDERACDGSAGDVDYGAVGGGYAEHRRPDPRIAARIDRALGTARTVVNVGAGAGSYEATSREVTAVEPSAAMRAQRPPRLAPAVDAVAEQLPFADDSFDAAMTTFSVHQWSDPAAGLRELRRVARGPVVVLTCDPRRVRDFWLYAYCPEVLDTEARRYPGIDALASALGGTVAVEPVPIPWTAPTASTRRTTGAPSASWTPAPAGRAPPGASSTSRPAPASPTRSAATWPTAPGTPATAPCANNASWRVRWSCSGPSRTDPRGPAGRHRSHFRGGCAPLVARTVPVRASDRGPRSTEERRAMPPTTFRIAIIGAGPGGLVCARVLQRYGVPVTVFERALGPVGVAPGGPWSCGRRPGRRRCAWPGWSRSSAPRPGPSARSSGCSTTPARCSTGTCPNPARPPSARRSAGASCAGCWWTRSPPARSAGAPTCGRCTARRRPAPGGLRRRRVGHLRPGRRRRRDVVPGPPAAVRGDPALLRRDLRRDRPRRRRRPPPGARPAGRPRHDDGAVRRKG
ncbi:methyltransferase domain-containing protein [Streptomyces noursei]|nr:methyltransferase domain-containing protein [Streptomyces noursei]